MKQLIFTIVILSSFLSRAETITEGSFLDSVKGHKFTLVRNFIKVWIDGKFDYEKSETHDQILNNPYKLNEEVISLEFVSDTAVKVETNKGKPFLAKANYHQDTEGNLHLNLAKSSEGHFSYFLGGKLKLAEQKLILERSGCSSNQGACVSLSQNIFRDSEAPEIINYVCKLSINGAEENSVTIEAEIGKNNFGMTNFISLNADFYVAGIFVTDLDGKIRSGTLGIYSTHVPQEKGHILSETQVGSFENISLTGQLDSGEKVSYSCQK